MWVPLAGILIRWAQTVSPRAVQAEVQLSTPSPSLATQVVVPSPNKEPTPGPLQNFPSSTPTLLPFSKVSPTAFEVKSSNLRRENLVTKIDVCFNTPGGEDWQIYSATFNLADQEFPIEASTPGDLHAPTLEYPEGFRCETIEFNLPPGENPRAGTLIIHSIAETLAEGKGCLKFTEEVHQALAREHIPIEFTCHDDHGYRLEIVRMPPAMSSGQAIQILTAFYIITGDWEFSFSQ